MFGKDAGSPGESKLNSIIGKGSNCEGEIVVGGGLKIDGKFKGKIFSTPTPLETFLKVIDAESFAPLLAITKPSKN